MPTIYNSLNHTMRTYDDDEISESSLAEGEQVVDNQQMAGFIAISAASGLGALRQELQTSIDYQEDTFEGFESNVNSLARDLQRLGRTMDANFQEFNARMVAQTAFAEGLSDRNNRIFGQLQRTSEELVASCTNDDERLKAIDDSNTEAVKSIEALKRQVEKLTEAGESINHRLSVCEEEIKDMKDISLANLKFEIKDKLSIADFNTKAFNAEARIGKLEKDLESLAREVAENANSTNVNTTYVERAYMAPEVEPTFATKLAVLAWKVFIAGCAFLERSFSKNKSPGQKLVDFLVLAEKEGKIVDVARIVDLRKNLGLSEQDDIVPLLQQYLMSSPESHGNFWHRA